MHFQRAQRVPDGRVGLTTGNVDFGQSRQGLSLERPIAQPFGRPQRRVRGVHGVVQLSLLAVADRKIVLRLDDAAVVARPLVGVDRAGVGRDGPAVVPLHVGYDAEVVGAAAGGGDIVLRCRLFQRAREEERRLLDAAALERDGAADVEGPHFEPTLLERPRPQLRDHGPVLAQFQPTEAAVRDAAEQGQHGGLLQLVLRPLAQVPEQLGVVPRISQALCHIGYRAPVHAQNLGLLALLNPL